MPARFAVTATVAAAAVALPSLAHADPTSRITAGVGLGITQSKAEAGQDPNDTAGLWGRLAISKRLSAQLELGKADTTTSGVSARTVGGLALLDLASGPTTGTRIVPYLLAGVGYDEVSSPSYEQTAARIEAGIGLELRAANGLVIGADVRIGDRSTGESSQVYHGYPTTIAFSLPNGLDDGEYRSARVTAGIHF
jgi:hypothetical protein